MNQFKAFQDALVDTFPSLTVFSDMNWGEVSREYIAAHDERPQDIDDFVFNFPQFLQDKAHAGDSPSYLFELAYFELLQAQIAETPLELPKGKGIHLNPTLSFLNLEFDIKLMMEEAAKGNVQIIERPHVLCIYRHPVRGLCQIDITTPYLKVLQELEQGPLSKADQLPAAHQNALTELIDQGIVLDIS